MAGDWIKMRSNLWDDPRIAKLCDITDQSEAAIVGGLYWLWATADQHSEDGLMHGLTLRAIDRKTGIPGFGEALVVAGWLADHPEGVRVVFEDKRGLIFIKGTDPIRPSGSEWSSIRISIFDRDGWKCVYCGSPEKLECDHIHPLSKGGTNAPENLATACFICNRSKGAKTLDEWSAQRG